MSINFLPHNKRLGYRSKHKNNWRVLREYVNEQLRKDLNKQKENRQ